MACQSINFTCSLHIVAEEPCTKSCHNAASLETIPKLGGHILLPSPSGWIADRLMQLGSPAALCRPQFGVWSTRSCTSTFSRTWCLSILSQRLIALNTEIRTRRYRFNLETPFDAPMRVIVQKGASTCGSGFDSHICDLVAQYSCCLGTYNG